jgi:hypothetical protein
MGNDGVELGYRGNRLAAERAMAAFKICKVVGRRPIFCRCGAIRQSLGARQSTFQPLYCKTKSLVCHLP